MLCRVEMPTNEQTFARFYRWRLLNGQGGGSAKFIFIWLPIGLGIFAAWGFFALGSPLPAFLFVLSLAYSIYSLMIKPGMQFKRRAGAALETEVYIFSDNSFVRNVRSEESGQMDHTSHQYDVLVRAVETKDDFFLFYGPSNAYIVDKEYFDKGTPEDLRAKLQEKMGKKFQTKQK